MVITILLEISKQNYIFWEFYIGFNDILMLLFVHIYETLTRGEQTAHLGAKILFYDQLCLLSA